MKDDTTEKRIPKWRIEQRRKDRKRHLRLARRAKRAAKDALLIFNRP